MTKLTFTRLPAEFGVRSQTEWEIRHEGRDYLLAKHGGQWWLYIRSLDPTDWPQWKTVSVKAENGVRCSMGTRIRDAKHNTTIFLCLDQGPDHENWRD